jgi:hypothetical protein
MSPFQRAATPVNIRLDAKLIARLNELPPPAYGSWRWNLSEQIRAAIHAGLDALEAARIAAAKPVVIDDASRERARSIGAELARQDAADSFGDPETELGWVPFHDDETLRAFGVAKLPPELLAAAREGYELEAAPKASPKAPAPPAMPSIISKLEADRPKASKAPAKGSKASKAPKSKGSKASKARKS